MRSVCIAAFAVGLSSLPATAQIITGIAIDTSANLVDGEAAPICYEIDIAVLGGSDLGPASVTPEGRMTYPLSFEAEEPEWNYFDCFLSLPDLEAEFPRLNHPYRFDLAGGAIPSVTLPYSAVVLPACFGDIASPTHLSTTPSVRPQIQWTASCPHDCDSVSLDDVTTMPEIELEDLEQCQPQAPNTCCFTPSVDLESGHEYQATVSIENFSFSQETIPSQVPSFFYSDSAGHQTQVRFTVVPEPPFGTNLITNPSFQTGNLSGWTIESGNPQVVSCPVPENIPCAPGGGDFVLHAGNVPDPSIPGIISQAISVSEFSSSIDSGALDFALSGCFGNDPTGIQGLPDDDIGLSMSFLDGSSQTLGTVAIGDPGGNAFFCGDDPVAGNAASGDIPVGTRSIEIIVSGMIVPPTTGGSIDAWADRLDLALVPEPGSGLLQLTAMLVVAGLSRRRSQNPPP